MGGRGWGSKVSFSGLKISVPAGKRPLNRAHPIHPDLFNLVRPHHFLLTEKLPLGRNIGLQIRLIFYVMNYLTWSVPN
jgi:hypothetical protein